LARGLVKELGPQPHLIIHLNSFLRYPQVNLLNISDTHYAIFYSKF